MNSACATPARFAVLAAIASLANLMFVGTAAAVPHTITSDDGTTFDSGTIPVGGTFRHTFTRAGTFPYHCNYHPYMRATISL